MTDLEYLEEASRLGYHISDFFLDDEDFSKLYIFDKVRENLLTAAWTSGSLMNWGTSFDEVLRNEFRALHNQLHIELSIKTLIENVVEPDQLYLFIGNNEYIDYAFRRLVKYVDLELRNVE